MSVAKDLLFEQMEKEERKRSEEREYWCKNSESLGMEPEEAGELYDMGYFDIGNDNGYFSESMKLIDLLFDKAINSHQPNLF